MVWKTGFTPRSSHTKDSKMVLDASLLNTHNYKIGIKNKWSNSGKGVAPSPTVVAIEKEDFRLPSTTVSQSTYYIYIYIDIDKIYIYIYIYSYIKVHTHIYIIYTAKTHKNVYTYIHIYTHTYIKTHTLAQNYKTHRILIGLSAD